MTKTHEILILAHIIIASVLGVVSVLIQVELSTFQKSMGETSKYKTPTYGDDEDDEIIDSTE